MKVLFSKKVYSELSALKQSEDYRALIIEICDVFMPSDREEIIAKLDESPAEFEPVRKKNWSIYAEGDNFVLEMDDEIFTIFMDSMKTHWRFAKAVVRPLKAIIDLAKDLIGAFGTEFKQIDKKLNSFFKDDMSKEDNVNPT